MVLKPLRRLCLGWAGRVDRALLFLMETVTFCPAASHIDRLIGVCVWLAQSGLQTHLMDHKKSTLLIQTTGRRGTKC